MELKQKIKEHFDLVSPYYYKLWGIHIHHGFWRHGNESKEKAQEQLIDELVSRGNIQQHAKILDVGCGIGGTTIYLAKKIEAEITGITISDVQVEMANELAQKHNINAKFLVMDGEHITLKEKFDIVWTIEVISHYYNKENFFSSASKLLKKGGKVVMAVWLKAEQLTTEQEKKYIKPIEYGMLLPGLYTLNDYISYLNKYGFRLLSAEDVSQYTAKTWDITLEIIKNPKLWKLAATGGKELISFLKSFQAIKRGYKSRMFVYGMIVAEKV